MSNKNIDWDNLSFSDLEILDFENIPAEHVDTVAKMMCLRKFQSMNNMDNVSLARLTGTHVNTVTNKSKGKSSFSVLDMMVMFAVRDMPEQDIKTIADTGGKLNLGKLWNMFR
jgi:hypothetical protein